MPSDSGTGRVLEAGPTAAVRDPDAALAAKIAFLSDPLAHADGAGDIVCIETHMSWVFLTQRYAYKLKKPVRTQYVDLREVAARARNCAEEVRLNRRLSSNVYLGAVPLVRSAAGRLTFMPEGEVVDWLVKMRRLPSERMLDRLLLAGLVRRADIEALVERLTDFYRNSPPAVIAPDAYCRELADHIHAYRRHLSGPAHGLSVELVLRICDRQLAFLAHAAPFDARVSAGRIVEGHGDLRPEHICLEAQPQIIDCLEFSRSLRTLDVIDELGFLALECERLGAPDIGRQIVDAFRERSGDAAPDALVAFYQSYRACVRAMLAIQHAQELPAQDPVKWRARAAQYLDLAEAHVARCT
jgi:aminoglycoside phosphotransferase family enzyme